MCLHTNCYFIINERFYEKLAISATQTATPSPGNVKYTPLSDPSNMFGGFINVYRKFETMNTWIILCYLDNNNYLSNRTFRKSCQSDIVLPAKPISTEVSNGTVGLYFHRKNHILSYSKDLSQEF